MSDPRRSVLGRDNDVAVPAVECEAVDVVYRILGASVHAVRSVDATFPPGRLSVLAGPSGSGKSSLLRVIAGLQRPTSGTVRIGTVEVSALRTRALRRFRRRAIGYVFQAPSANLLPYLAAGDQIRLAAQLRGDDATNVDGLLSALGLGGRAGVLPAALSGGEQQRLAFAAAAVGGPELVVADEPTAQLDDASGALLVGVLRALADRETTLIVASHDPALMDAADRLILLREGVAQVIR